MEMKETRQIKYVDILPRDLANCMNSFNCDNTKDLRQQLLQSHDCESSYDQKKHHDFEWVKHTIFSFVRPYEPGNLKKIQKEAWYMVQ